MSSEKLPTPVVQTPEGDEGVVLHWPQSGNFRILRGNGTNVEYINVVPVLMESGEVRLFHGAVLKTLPLRP